MVHAPRPGRAHAIWRTSRSNAEVAKSAKSDRISLRPSRPLRSTPASVGRTLASAQNFDSHSQKPRAKSQEPPTCELSPEDLVDGAVRQRHDEKMTVRARL